MQRWRSGMPLLLAPPWDTGWRSGRGRLLDHGFGVAFGRSACNTAVALLHVCCEDLKEKARAEAKGKAHSWR